MTLCKHSNLLLVSETKDKVRCRDCHLTITTDELGGGYCPECFETQGKKQYDFEPVEKTDEGKTVYRCEGCGVAIECE